MSGVGRVHPPNRQVLKDISLGFYYGAKIGVLGLNGSGKSTLLGIIAGKDKDYIGEVAAEQGLFDRAARAGPAARPGQDRGRDRSRGRPARRRPPGPVRRGLRQDGRPRRRHGRPARRAGPPAGGDRQARRLEPRQPSRDRHGGPALPAAGDARDGAFGRRAPPRRPDPAPAHGARHPAPRRADQPPRRRVGRLAREAPSGIQGHGHRRDPRPLFPRQRGRLDPRARPRRGHPLEGQLLVVARAEAGPAGGRREDGIAPPADPGPRARVGPDVAQGPAGQGQGPRHRLREAPRPGLRALSRRPGAAHPAGAAPRRRGHRARGRDQGLRRPGAHGRPDAQHSRRARSSGSSARTGPARRPCCG